jgi:hypothetical protein
VQWPAVFALIKQTEPLWQTWKPSKTLDQMSVQLVWDCYNTGEAVLDESGQPTGMKPPLRLVEQHFQTSWRKGPIVSDTPFSQPFPTGTDRMQQRKTWQRFREIPEWIEAAAKARVISPAAAIAELEVMQEMPNTHTLLGTSALSKLLSDQRKAAAAISTFPPLQPPIFDAILTQAPAASMASEATSSPSHPSSLPAQLPNPLSSPLQKKRRAPTIGGRGKQKKSRNG